MLNYEVLANIYISTHAPLRGATHRAHHRGMSEKFLLTRLCEARRLLWTGR